MIGLYINGPGEVGSVAASVVRPQGAAGLAATLQARFFVM